MATVRGLDCKLYYNTTAPTPAAVPDSGVGWVLAANVKDVDLDGSTDQADVTTRNNNGWKAARATLKDGSITFSMVYDTSDAAFTAFKDAWEDGTTIGVEMLSGVRTVQATVGLRAEMSVTNFRLRQPLDGVMEVDVTVTPTLSTYPATWVDEGPGYVA